MKPLLIIVLMFFNGSVQAQSEADELVARALNGLNQSDYRDTSTAVRLLQEAISLEPEHIEANWQLLRIQFAQIKPYIEYIPVAPLPQFSQRFKKFEELLLKQKSTALLHYAQAHHAYLYSAFERAQQETDQALALEPNSSRFWYWQGELLYRQGVFEKNDELVKQSQTAFGNALKHYSENPYPGIELSDIYNSIASAEIKRDKPNYESAITHYTKGIESSSSTQESLYAWQRLSVALRHLNRCQEALDAANKALEIVDDREGQQAKRYAEFCLELQGEPSKTAEYR